VSRQLGQTGQDDLIRAKFDGLPRKPTTISPGCLSRPELADLRKIKGKIGLDERKSIPPIKGNYQTTWYHSKCQFGLLRTKVRNN